MISLVPATAYISDHGCSSWRQSSVTALSLTYIAKLQVDDADNNELNEDPADTATADNVSDA